MQLNGQEVMVGCVLQLKDGKVYRKVLAVKDNKCLASDAFATTKEAEDYFGSNVSLFTDYGLSSYHVCLYPVVSHDKNGEPLRYGDEVVVSNGEQYKVIGGHLETVIVAVIVEDKIFGKGWDWYYCSEVTKLPKEVKPAKEDIEEAINVLKRAGMWEDRKVLKESQNK